MFSSPCESVSALAVEPTKSYLWHVLHLYQSAPEQILNYVNAILYRLSISTPSRFATVSSYATDLGNTAIFPALCSGGSVHLISRERASDAKALADYFRINPVDYLKIVPSHLSALLVSQNRHILPKKGLILGGEVCHWDLIEQVKELNPDCTIFNHYGPTEATVGVTTYRIKNSDNNLTSSTVPIGKPLSNIQVYLLDSMLQPDLPGAAFPVRKPDPAVTRN